MNKKTITAENAPKAVGPYSHAVLAGGFLYTSGQIGCHPTTGCVAEGGIREQAKQVFENLQAVLEAAGAGFQDVVKATVFLTDMKDFAVVNEIYASFFDGEFPARSCVEVAGLPRDVDVEIEMVAFLGV
jgi:2-iminobutanoate/2-iminopropanoate deaminase